MHRNAAESGLRAWLRSHVGLRIAELVDREGATTMVRLQLLGAPQLHAADGSMRALERREAALLALLAIEGPLPRSRAAALLWSDADSEHARSSLRQRLFKLRRSAGIDIVVPDDVLRLADGVAHDLVPIAPRLAEDPAAGAAELLGELDYSDCPGLDEWVAVAREQWRSRRIQALAEIAARLETEQKVAAALPYAERLVADDPTLEHGHRRLMRLHYLRGDRAAALAVYARCRELLRLHAGAAPGRETVELARLIEGSGELPASGRQPLPPSVLRPPKLIGRDAEWAQIDLALEARQTALVLGEPGIGKSRLIGDWAGHHDALRVTARAGDARLPYALLCALLRALRERFGLPAPAWVTHELARLLPELGSPSGGPLAPQPLQAAVEQVCAHAQQAGLTAVVVDDLQFADPASLDMLPALIDGRSAVVCWVLAARSADVPAAIDGWLRAQDADAMHRIVLAPLNEQSVRELLQSLAIDGLDVEAWVAPLQRHTGGNPLYILETLRDQIQRGAAPNPAALSLPQNVGALIARRLDQLTPEALRLARVAALAARDFGPALAARVLGRDMLELVEPWSELEAAHVLRDNAFSHDLILATVRRGVPGAIAAALHRQIAALLAEGDAPAAAVAHHWHESGEWLRAAQAYESAAMALRSARRDDQVELLGRAVDDYRRAGQNAAAFAASCKLALAQLHVVGPDAAQQTIDGLQAQASSDDERLDLLMLGVDVAVVRGRNEQAIGSAREAAALALRLDRPRDHVHATMRAAQGMAMIGQTAPALEALAGIEATSAALDDEARYEYRAARAYIVQRVHGHRAALPDLESALALARSLDNRGELLVSLNNLAGVCGYFGDMERALALAFEATRIKAGIGRADGIAAVNELNLGSFLFAVGRYREAIETLVAACDVLREGHNEAMLAQAESTLAALYLTLGQTQRAGAILTPLPSGLAPFVQARRLQVQAQIDRALHRPFEAALRRAVELTDASSRGLVWLLARADLCLAMPHGQAADAARTLADDARRMDFPAVTALALMREAAAALGIGQAARAAAVAGEALDLALAAQATALYRPELAWVAYRCHEAAGDSGAALAALKWGRDWVLDTAWPNVPDEFRDSFRDRNPVNRDLLAAAGRVLR